MKNLSLGQLHRIAIARALLADCPILVMDEVTSALDYKMEEKVLEQLMSASKDKICIVTTHRDSVLKYCDKVYECLPYVQEEKSTVFYKPPCFFIYNAINKCADFVPKLLSTLLK